MSINQCKCTCVQKTCLLIVNLGMEETGKTVEKSEQPEKIPLSCVKYIDAIWFCYCK